ncbi:unnamed protein product, partial [Mesorhabditis belari]|uniref:Uncharacterized protein n=1 Tax=Mesorhabditis belari TaxID=2138241 RepID=A0AAF3E7V6_9BILA
MSWPSSYQQQLPSSVPAGWNDPPSIGPGAASSRLSRHKRLVDPSINGTGQQQFGASPGQPYQQQTNSAPAHHYGSPVPVQQVHQQPGQNMPMQQQQQPMAQQVFRLTPQLPAGNSAALSQCRVFQQTVDTLITILLLHKIYDFYKLANFLIVVTRQFFNNFLFLNFVIDMGPTTLGDHQVTTAQTSQSSYRPVFDAFSVNRKEGKSDIFGTRNSLTTQSSDVSTEWNEAGQFDTPQSTQSTPILNQKSASLPERRDSKQSSTAPSTPTPSSSLERQPTSLIYSAPNCIAEGVLRSSLASIDSLNYRAPVKAAGDVSLSGNQCVAFLTKASMRLHPVKCEGVQLRLASLKEQVMNDAITDSCIKKLNFVVDAVDREQYEEAWIFFEQLQQCFPTEMGTWAHGLRLLISELKRSPSRTGSAGSQRLRTQ